MPRWLESKMAERAVPVIAVTQQRGAAGSRQTGLPFLPSLPSVQRVIARLHEKGRVSTCRVQVTDPPRRTALQPSPGIAGSERDAELAADRLPAASVRSP